MDVIGILYVSLMARFSALLLAGALALAPVLALALVIRAVLRGPWARPWFGKALRSLLHTCTAYRRLTCG